jgi:protein-tyrosine phosphatase
MEILCVCTGNICRSPMAEGLLTRLVADRGLADIRVHSAGTHALDGRPAEPHAVTAARELGADISGHIARSLDPAMVAQADLILVMEQGHADLIARVLTPARQAADLRLLADYSPLPDTDEIDDPYGQSLKTYRACADRIRQCLEAVADQIARRSAAGG